MKHIALRAISRMNASWLAVPASAMRSCIKSSSVCDTFTYRGISRARFGLPLTVRAPGSASSRGRLYPVKRPFLRRGDGRGVIENTVNLVVILFCVKFRVFQMIVFVSYNLSLLFIGLFRRWRGLVGFGLFRRLSKLFGNRLFHRPFFSGAGIGGFNIGTTFFQAVPA